MSSSGNKNPTLANEIPPNPMSDPAEIQAPVLYWLNQRARYIKNPGKWEWIPGDPVVGHMAAAVFLLGQRGMISLSEKTSQELSEVYWHNIASWLLRENLVKKIIDAFVQADVGFIPLKGAALQDLLYKNIGLRPMADIDLLVHPDTFLAAVKVIRALGYSVCEKDQYEKITWFEDLPRSYWPKELSFSSPNSMVIELHQALITSWFQPAFPIDMQNIWKRSSSLSSTDQTLPSTERIWRRFLSPYDMLAHLCLHLAMHGLKYPQGYLDVDLWIRDLPKSWDWNKFMELVDQWQIHSAAYHVLSFCREFMDTPLPNNLLERLDPGWWARVRVWILISSKSLLAHSSTLGTRYPTLVKLALIDRIPRMIWTLFRLAFPNRNYYQAHPSRRNILANWLHVFRAIKHHN
jgi:hypothetical protein